MAKYRDLYHRLVANTKEPESNTGCWEHQGKLSRPGVGYPRINLWVKGKAKGKLAHVLMFQHFNGPVPEGKEVDHTCHNHRCINPDHLQALPVYDNRAKNRPQKGC